MSTYHISLWIVITGTKCKNDNMVSLITFSILIILFQFYFKQYSHITAQDLLHDHGIWFLLRVILFLQSLL